MASCVRTRRRRWQQAPIRPPQQRLRGSTIKAGPACKLTSPSTASRPLSMKGARASRLGNLPAPDTSRRKIASFTGERQLQPYGRQRQLSHHQSSILGTAGNYKIYSGHERAGSGGTAGTRQYPGTAGIRQYMYPGPGNVSPGSTRTAGTPGLRTSTGARQQLGQTLAGPWPSQGNIVPDLPNKLPPQDMGIRYQAADA